jgi:hypothetical protein
MGEPTSQLRGDLRAQDRYGALVAVVGEPNNEAESALLVLLARLLSNAEVATFILLVKRVGQTPGQ